MELMVISPADYFEGEAEIYNRFFAAGLTRLHIRKPKGDEDQFRRLMEQIKPDYYPCLALHQQHGLAEEYSIRRLHYTEGQRKLMKAAELDELRGQGFCLSSSVHHLEELAQMQGFDYVFFGPVYDSISKIGYQSSITADFLLPEHSLKVIAIGGLKAEKLGSIKAMGFDGAAFLGAIWHAANPPLVEFKKTIDLFKTLS
jgi:thiamine-phosphate pyrophosphorylase